MKKLIVTLCAAAAWTGCEQGQEMNEPSGTERPTYQAPESSTNGLSAPSNQTGLETNDGTATSPNSEAATP